MQTPPKLLYPALVVAAISVTLFSLLGIATLTGHLPVAHSSPQDQYAVDAAAGVSTSPATAAPATQAQTNETLHPAVAAPAAGSAGVPVRTASRPLSVGTGPAAAAASCAACGTVESISAVERKGNSSGVGAVAGGLTGLLLGNQVGRGNGRTGMTILGGAGGAYLGNRIEQNMNRTTSYRINVRMDDGKVRTLYQREAPDVAVGRHVEIVGGSVVPRS